MKSPHLTLFCLLLGSAVPVTARAGKPPVTVDVVVDGDEGDFFEEDAPAAQDEDKAKAGVKKSADKAFQDLSAEEQVRVRSPGDGKNNNVNTQVVNVVVSGNKDTSGTSAVATPAVPATPAAPATLSVPPVPPVPAVPAAPPVASVQSQPKPQRDFWDAESYAEEGNFLASVSGGGYAGGGFIGFNGEGLATDQLGIRIGVSIAGFDDNTVRFGGLRSNFDVFSGGVWANRRPITPDNVQQGVAYLGDLGLVFHFLQKSMFDPYASAGLAHYGYEINFNDGTDRGGAGYTRLATGFNVHFSRFFAGLDFAWYPYEMYRFRLDETPHIQGRGDRGGRDFVAVTEPVEDRFVPERYVLAGQVGLRF